MRVIAGSAKGRRLKGPPARSATTRPTSDLLRGAIFNSLASLGADYSRVLDLYAGSGALGIEALSRGDGRCDFVESDRAAAAVIRENLRLTGFEDRARVLQAPAARAVDLLKEPCTLVLADPPYADEEALPLLTRLAVSSLVNDETVLVLEHSADVEPQDVIGSLTLVNTRRHGGSAVSIYARR
jgi:16S rRNA (guanine(966)-N(2))-methyltransferase RsmD